MGNSLVSCFLTHSAESDTISQEKGNLKIGRTTVWIKWPTQGRATYV